jgi:hypothetical protein
MRNNTIDQSIRLALTAAAKGAKRRPKKEEDAEEYEAEEEELGLVVGWSGVGTGADGELSHVTELRSHPRLHLVEQWSGHAIRATPLPFSPPALRNG